MSYKLISASVLPQILSESGRVIDVRTPAEYRALHVTGAELLPLDQLQPADFIAEQGSDCPVYILCQSGKRACLAAQRLVAEGHKAVHVVEGGTNAAQAAGLELERGQQVISLERQVRIAAGLMVFTGTLAGVWLHPAYLILPAFVGAGLTFAGITDTCGMGMLLSKMPWNR